MKTWTFINTDILFDRLSKSEEIVSGNIDDETNHDYMARFYRFINTILEKRTGGEYSIDVDKKPQFLICLSSESNDMRTVSEVNQIVANCEMLKMLDYPEPLVLSSLVNIELNDNVPFISIDILNLYLIINCFKGDAPQSRIEELMNDYLKHERNCVSYIKIIFSHHLYKSDILAIYSTMYK